MLSSAARSEAHPLHGSGWNAAAACIQPLYDLFVGPAEVVVTVDLPYVDQKRVKLRCPTEEIMEVYAETSKKITFKDLGAKHRHGEFTCFRASIRFPVPVNEKKMTTEFKRGILEIHIPRLT